MPTPLLNASTPLWPLEERRTARLRASSSSSSLMFAKRSFQSSTLSELDWQLPGSSNRETLDRKAEKLKTKKPG
jgi:hypothetical protein